jgi:hypothetical protein
MSEIRGACWLAPGLLAFLATIDAGGEQDAPDAEDEPEAGGSAAWRVLAGGDAEPRSGLPAQWLHCGPDPGGGAWWLFTVAIGDPPDGDQPLGHLTLAGDGETEHDLTPHGDEPVVGTVFELARTIKDTFEPWVRGRVQAFLAFTLTRHQTDAAAQLAAHLNQIRDILREPLPRTHIAPGPFSARLERVTAIDEHAFWLTGWVHDADPRQTRLTAISPEGTRSQLEAGAVTYHPRPAYARALDDPRTGTLGFHAYVQLGNPSIHPDGWTLELESNRGQLFEDTVRAPVNRDATELWDHVLEQLRADPDDEAALRHHVLPTLARLRHNEGRPRIEHLAGFGEVSPRPDVSLVVAARRLDRIEHQLGQFVRDPELRLPGVELIYVTPPGTAANPAAVFVEELQALYGLPLRLAVLSQPATRARALNLGASVARGRVLALMSGDVLPAGPGWLGTLMKALASSAQIGAAAPKLLREDDSIAHAGVAYTRRPADGRWRRTLPLAGFARSVDAATRSRPIQAGSDACLVIDAERFGKLDGFSELYLGESDEAGDLCLRLAASGLQTWYVPEAELYLLDRPEVERKPSPLRDPFNGWLLGERCGAVLDGDDPEVPASIPDEPSPEDAMRVAADVAVADSGRSGPPIERLEVIPATASAQLRTGSVSPGAAGDPRSPYEGTYSIVLEGCALAPDGAPLSVRTRALGLRERSAEANLASPGLAEEHPGAPGADRAGYHLVLSSLALPVEFELDVDAVGNGGARAPLGRVRGRRRPLRSGYEPEVQPLLVTMLGRTGSTWLMALLSRHPQLFSYSPFVYEPMLASYFAAMLQTLAEPDSYMQAILPELYDELWWTGRGHRSPLPRHKLQTDMARWLGRESIEGMAAFCQTRLDVFYKHAARVDGRPTPKFFAEKCVPGATGRLLGELYPDGREIVLVRDFRDRVCSIREYNAKQGHELWGRDRTTSDEEWFGYLRNEAIDLLENWRERRDRVHLVRYEDLIRDPGATLEALFSYVGVDASAATVQRVRALAEAMLPKAQLNHQTSPSVEASIGRWKQELTPEEQAACAEAFDDLLVEFGYEPTGAG